MPNTFAYVMLASWPLISLVLFAAMLPHRALVWALLGGYLLLPVGTAFDFPGVPSLDKASIVNLSVFVGAVIFAGGRVARLPKEWWLNALMLIYLLSPILTVRTNSDVLIFGSTVLPALRPYDAIASAAYKLIDLLPFLLGYNLLRTSAAQHDLLRTMAITIVGYSLLMLIEVRLSPQLHNWVYGFFPHMFSQQIRDGGFRPAVFLGHGLEVAILTALCIIAMSYFAKLRSRILFVDARLWLIYLLIVMVLCRSLGALILALGALGVLMIFRAKQVYLLCAVAAASVLIYPALRSADIAPVQWLADQVASYDEERSGSLQYRIDNENALLDRANERPLFGWGGYSRNRVYEEYSGRDLSVTDGEWIIVIGTHGWVGYIAFFGLLCLPIIKAWRQRERTDALGAALAMIIMVNLIDSLPNTSVHNHTWLIAGALAYGRPAKSGAKRSRALTTSPAVR